MKSEKFSNALGKIDVRYVEEVVNYKAASKHKWLMVKIAAACIVFAVITVGIVPFILGNKEESPFVLTAYAYENNTAVENILVVGEKVPVSYFETENGLNGFVFSHAKEKTSEISSISIMTEGEMPGVIDEIVGLELETDKHYTLYVPEQSKGFPYSFMIPYTDEAANKVIFCYLLVEETENGYTAVIERMEEFERIVK